MKEVAQKEVVCVFCGKKRIISIEHDDGYDWCGHKRGQEKCVTHDDGCYCVLGKLEHEPIELKEMCLNCKFYDGINCTNKEELSEVSALFDCGEKLKVKNPTRNCKHWKFNALKLEKIISN